MMLPNRKIDYFFIALLLCLSAIFVVSINFLLEWPLKGDAIAYFQSLRALQGDIVAGFIPNRLLTTFFSLQTVLLINTVVHNFLISWLTMNLAFYYILNLTFYVLVKKIFNSAHVAFLGSLFLATNYGILLGGMWNFIMDMGGWAFYVLATFFLLKYGDTKRTNYLYFTAVLVGIGALFKEYAFGGFVLLATYLFYESTSVVTYIKKIIVPMVVVFGPIALLHSYIYIKYHYTYLDWAIDAQAGYVYSSRIVEYIKSFGSLINFLAFPLFGGIYYFWQDRTDHQLTSSGHKVFIIAVAISTLPVFLWQAITQRTLALTIVPIILIAGFMFKRYQRHWYLFIPVLVLYAVTNFFMDGYVLDFVNLPL